MCPQQQQYMSVCVRMCLFYSGRTELVVWQRRTAEFVTLLHQHASGHDIIPFTSMPSIRTPLCHCHRIEQTTVVFPECWLHVQKIRCATVAVSFVGSKSLSGKYHTLKVDKNAQRKPRMQMLLGNIIQTNLVPVILITILLYCNSTDHKVCMDRILTCNQQHM